MEKLKRAKEENNMKIQNLQVLNFQGLKGQHLFNLSKIMAFCQENGAGKTSVRNALIFGLTGVEPSGEIVYSGEEYAEVTIVLENGQSFGRRKYADNRQSKFYLNGEASSLSAVNNALETLFPGINLETGKIATSSEILLGLTSQQFGETLLKYLPEQMDKNIVLSKFEEATEDEKEIISSILPDGEFGIETLNSVYSTLVERRKLVKQKLAETQGILKSYESLVTPSILATEIPAKIQELEVLKKSAIEYNAKLNAYTRSKQVVENHQKMLADAQLAYQNFRNQYGVLTPHTDEEVAAVNRELATAKQMFSQTSQQLAITKQNGVMITEAIKNVSQPICPLSKKLVCHTDKTPILSEMEAERNVLRQNYMKLEASLKMAEAKVTETEAILNKINNDKALENQLRILVENINNLSANVPQLPPEPTPVNVDLNQINSQIQGLNAMANTWNMLAKKEECEQKLLTYNNKLMTYESLCIAFAPKGKVKESIISFYVEEFSKPCNEKAREIFQNMDIKFVFENGIKVMVDVDGTNQYITFDSLSGGEKACVTFVLLSMLSQLAGFNILIMDELSVLDQDVFTKLIKLIKQNEDSFDHCLIACVNHSDIISVLKEEGIDVVELNRMSTLLPEKKKRTRKKSTKKSADVVAEADDSTQEDEGEAEEPSVETAVDTPIVSDQLPESFNITDDTNKNSIVENVANASGLAVDEIGDIFGVDL